MASTDFATGMKCRVCGKLYPKSPINFCVDDFGPLEVSYDYEKVRSTLTRAKIEKRPRTMWLSCSLFTTWPGKSKSSVSGWCAPRC